MSLGPDGVDDRVRGYASEVVGGGSRAAVTAVARFDTGDRHAVYRVSCRGPEGETTEVVVRVSTGDDPTERAQAAHEAAVLRKLNGVGAPRLYDYRAESDWFETPAMCMAFVDGEHRDLVTAPLDHVERLGSVVASVHGLPVDDLLISHPGATTVAGYVEECLDRNASYLPRLRHPLPSAVQGGVDDAFALVTSSLDRARTSALFETDDRLVLLHGDVGSGNILWAEEPVLIDWEYARLGDAADEIAYIFGQHGLAPPQRDAFWAGYRRASAHPRLEHVIARARWWEPVNLLGSALWWLERWSRSAAAAAAGDVDPSAPKPPGYYLDQAARRLDRINATESDE